ncbi:ChrR family anti-sigma-E factor [Lacibacterium aquatile]|uniref:ChrR family anti-sigma-E factor n=1 Tax=Lacibacterium aquatile TaxID=1168082 RepID=A0ABW5DMD4_9PROT
MSASMHPSDDILLAYGAGSLDEATSLLVASHLTFCGECRKTLHAIEAVGGAVLEDLPPETMKEDALERMLDRLSEETEARPARFHSEAAGSLPRVLQSYIGGDLSSVRWKRLAPGLEHSLVMNSGRARARLYRIAPGIAVPDHGHGGTELTLVLQGGFSDGETHFGRGDVAIADSATIHHPVADPDGVCICLAVTDAPLRLTGFVGRMISPFIKL